PQSTPAATPPRNPRTLEQTRVAPKAKKKTANVQKIQRSARSAPQSRALGGTARPAARDGPPDPSPRSADRLLPKASIQYATTHRPASQRQARVHRAPRRSPRSTALCPPASRGCSSSATL